MTAGTNGWPRDDDHDLRRRNRETVEAYMDQITGSRRRQRHLLFTDDGSAGLETTESGEPIVMTGRESLREHAEWSLACLPDWRWYNIEVFETQYPNRFWVECDGEGKLLFPGYPETHYANHFLHYFELCDGKITRQREFMNPVLQLRALGLEVPRVERAGIPADS